MWKPQLFPNKANTEFSEIDEKKAEMNVGKKIERRRARNAWGRSLIKDLKKKIILQYHDFTSC